MEEQALYMEELCQENHVHEDVLMQVRANMPDDNTLCAVAELFKVLGDPTRAKILSALFEAELCVCDLSEIIHLSVSAVSHQLRILRQAKLVRNRRCGKEVYYTLDDTHVSKIYQMTLEHLKEERIG